MHCRLHWHARCILTPSVLIYMEGRVKVGVAWRSVMHYELRSGETRSLNNVSHVTDTRETGPVPGVPPPLIGLDLFMGQTLDIAKVIELRITIGLHYIDYLLSKWGQ